MDKVFRELTQGTSCSADGSAQISNPLSKFVNDVLGLDNRQFTNTSSLQDMTQRVDAAYDKIMEGMNRGMGLSTKDEKLFNQLEKTKMELEQAWNECNQLQTHQSARRIDALANQFQDFSLAKKNQIQNHIETNLSKINGYNGLFMNELINLKYEDNYGKGSIEKYYREHPNGIIDEDKDRPADINLIKYWIKLGADLNTQYNSEENTPLMEAIIYGDLDLVKFMVEHGANVNAYNEYFNVLQLAGDRKDIVKYLIENGADVNMKAGEGESYLEFLIMFDDLPMVKWLIENNLVNLSTMIRRVVDDVPGMENVTDEFLDEHEWDMNKISKILGLGYTWGRIGYEDGWIIEETVLETLIYQAKSKKMQTYLLIVLSKL